MYRLCRRPRAARAPNAEKLLLKNAREVRQLKNGYIALTQPHVDRLRSNITRWYSVAPNKLRNSENPLRVKCKMADDA